LEFDLAEEQVPRLGGEADPNSWHFQRIDKAGPLPNPIGHTFPLLTHDDQGIWSLVGTGFYISEDGLFVTARHVMEHVLRDGRQVAPLVILHAWSSSGLFVTSAILFRPISQCWLSDQADLALGVAATATNNQTGEVLRHWCWPLSWSMPAVGTPIGTYAFPRHTVSGDGREFVFQPELYPGYVLHAADFRDSSMITFPYLEVDCRIHGSASGGPIVQNGGRVVGANCTEWPDNLDHPPGPGFGVQIRCLKEAYIDNAVLVGEHEPRRVTFDEIVRAGCISVENYAARNSNDPLSGTLIRFDEVPVSAAHPKIVFVQQY
jgi:hypothetical protein